MRKSENGFASRKACFRSSTVVDFDDETNDSDSDSACWTAGAALECRTVVVGAIHLAHFRERGNTLYPNLVAILDRPIICQMMDEPSLLWRNGGQCKTANALSFLMRSIQEFGGPPGGNRSGVRRSFAERSDLTRCRYTSTP